MAWKKEMSKEEKDALKEKKKEDMEAIFRRIDEGVKEVFTSEKYMEYLRVMSKFTDYSARNTLLIAMQKPDASLVAAYGKWKQLGRQVKKGESGIEILAPVAYKTNRFKEIKKPILDENGNKQYNPDGSEKTEVVRHPIMDVSFKKVYVFDVSQTDGKELPGLVSDLKGNYDEDKKRAIMKGLVRATGIEIKEAEIEGGARGYYSPSEDTIVLRKGMSDAQTLKTAFHECAHKLLHDPNLESVAAQSARNEKEVQAESTAFIVAEKLGLDTSEYSFPYIASWSDGKQLDQLTKVLDEVQQAAKKLSYFVESELLKLSKRDLSREEMLSDMELDNIQKAEILIDDCKSRGISLSAEAEDIILSHAGEHEDIYETVSIIDDMEKKYIKGQSLDEETVVIIDNVSKDRVSEKLFDAVLIKQDSFKGRVNELRNTSVIGNTDYFELCKEPVQYFKNLNPRHAMNISKALEDEGIPFSGVKNGERVTLTIRKADLSEYEAVVEKVKESYTKSRQEKAVKDQNTNEAPDAGSDTSIVQSKKISRDIKNVPIITMSRKEASEKNCLQMYSDNIEASKDCRNYIDEYLYDAYEKRDLKGFAMNLEERFGLQRVMYTVAATIQLKDDDGRFTSEVKKEASEFIFDSDNTRRELLTEQHPVRLNNLYQILIDLKRNLSQELTVAKEPELPSHLSDLFLFSTERVSIHNDYRGLPETTYYNSSVNEYKVEKIGWLDNDDYERELKLSGDSAKGFYSRVKLINAACIDQEGKISHQDMTKDEYKLMTEKTYDGVNREMLKEAKARLSGRKEQRDNEKVKTEYYAVREEDEGYSVITVSEDGLITPIKSEIPSLEEARKSILDIYEQRKEIARCELVHPQILDEKSCEMLVNQTDKHPDVLYRIQLSEDKKSAHTHILQQYLRNDDDTYKLGEVSLSGDYFDCNVKLAELLSKSLVLSESASKNTYKTREEDDKIAMQEGTYAIYQLKDGEENNTIRFESYENIEKDGFKADESRYDKVYEGKLKDVSESSDERVQLEAIFYIFNMERPEDFKGHSLSVSDVVVINDKAYYVDKVGYKEVSDFFTKSLDQKMELTCKEGENLNKTKEKMTSL